MLAGNAQLNGLANVRISGCGLWSSSGVRLKLDGFDSFANAVDAEADDGDAFATVSIDDYRARERLKIGLIQLDIEGAEHAALQGARATLAEDRPHVVFEVHRHYVDWRRGLARTKICRLARARSATRSSRCATSTRIARWATGRSSSCRSTPVYLDGPPHGFNMLAVQDPRRVEGPGVPDRRERQPEAARPQGPGAASPDRRALASVRRRDRDDAGRLATPP
jgi:FkbM family methyltransferase